VDWYISASTAHIQSAEGFSQQKEGVKQKCGRPIRRRLSGAASTVLLSLLSGSSISALLGKDLTS